MKARISLLAANICKFQNKINLYSVLVISCLLLINHSFSQSWSYPGCADVDNNDFSYTTLVKRGEQPDPEFNEPLKMTFYQQPNGDIDIFYTERRGKLKIYHGSTGTVTELHEFNVPWTIDKGGPTGNAEEGLVGITLDPNFETNRWLYVFWAPMTGDTRGPADTTWRVSRFTLNPTFTSISDEVVIIEFGVQTVICCHQGGSIAFDDYGDLWITVGNNEGRGGICGGGRMGINENEQVCSGEWGASSTASLRGATLRIRPLPDGSYTIPSGNFWEHFGNYFEDQGNAALAAEYRDPAKVKRELYTKGNRNPFSITLDPVRRWLGYGDVGPDGSLPEGNGMGEEHNLHTEPAFAGWPYFAGNNGMNTGDKDENAPMNTSKWNTGVTQLPPATPGFDVENNSAAISGPLYRYNTALQSDTKFPPHFHRKWFVTNFSTRQTHVITISEDGKEKISKERIFENHQFDQALAMEMGPDGSLYVLHYSGGFQSNDNARIERIDYTGPDCDDATIEWESTGCKIVGDANFDAGATHSAPCKCADLTQCHSTAAAGPRPEVPSKFHTKLVSLMYGDQRLSLKGGGTELNMYSLSGKKVWTYKIAYGEKEILIPGHLAKGIYKVRISY